MGLAVSNMSHHTHTKIQKDQESQVVVGSSQLHEGHKLVYLLLVATKMLFELVKCPFRDPTAIVYLTTQRPLKRFIILNFYS